MSDGGRQHKPGSASDVGPDKVTEDPAYIPRGAERDRSWPLTDPMRYVRYERQQAAAQIQRSLAAWRKESAKRDSSQRAAIPQQGGSSLGDGVRTKMEQQLGADLSDAKIHTGGESAKAAEGMGARAFTAGSDVHFASGEFVPGTKEGDRLLAHELTHVVQGQKSGIQRKKEDNEPEAELENDVEVSNPEDAPEKEADHVADAVADNLHGHGGEAAGEHAASGEGTGTQQAPGAGITAKQSAVGRKVFRATSSSQPQAPKPGLLGRLFGGGKKAPPSKGQPVVPKDAEQLDPLVKNVRELLDRPIPPETRKDLEKQWQMLDKAAADLRRALAAADPALVAQAEAEVDGIRMQASGTVQGKHGAVGGGGAPDLARENWKKAAAMVHGWAASRVPISIDGLRKINEVLGAGLENNGGTPGEVRTKEVFTRAKGGGFNPYLPPKEVPAELAAAVAWYQANKVKLKGPELAAQMYQRLVSIHPFMDANGRTCRLAMDWVLQSHGLPPAAVQGEEVNVAVFGLDPVAGRESVAPDHAVKAVTAGILRAIEVMKRVISQAKK